MSKEKAVFKFPAGAGMRLRHSACGDPTTIWKEVKTGAVHPDGTPKTNPDGKPETKTVYYGDTLAKRLAGICDDLILVGGLKFHPTKPKVMSPAMKGDWPRLMRDLNAAKIQVSAGLAPQDKITFDDKAFNDWVFGKDTLKDDPGMEKFATALVDAMNADLPGWAGISFDIEHIVTRDIETQRAPSADRLDAARNECRDRMTLFYQAVCIAAHPKMVQIVAGAKISEKYAFHVMQNGTWGLQEAIDFARLHDWNRITALPNSTLLAMAYDGNPGGGDEGMRRWHRETIEYGTTTKTMDPNDRPMIHPTKFQLLIKTGKSDKPGEPGLLQSPTEIDWRMRLAREFSVGVGYFPVAPANVGEYEKTLNTNGGAPKAGAADGHPYQHPIADVVAAFP